MSILSQLLEMGFAQSLASVHVFFSSFPHRLTLSSVLRSNDGKTLMIGMQGQLWLLTVKEKDLFGCIG